jgi:HD-GYP domain-containing protein (c-di-GMP phosphodiesterase class II)
MFKMVAMSTLRVGAVLASPIYDSENTKLLAPAIPITEELLEKLRKRGVSSIAVHERDLARLAAFQPHGTSNNALPGRPGVRAPVDSELTRVLDEYADAGQLPLGPMGEPFANAVKPRDPVSYDRDAMNDVAEHHQQCVEQLDSFYGSLKNGDNVDLSLVNSISQDTLVKAAEDLDLFVCLGINPTADSYPGRHSMHVSMLAMSIGANMGFDQKTLTELGLGCLVHDAGMLQINQKAFQARRVLDPLEFTEITKHPARTFDMLAENLDELPAAARMVAYQMHERCNGSGYPRGRTASQIHLLAKVAAVADTFTALVSPRPHRPGMLPYRAIVKILEDVKNGLFDPAVVRALLNTVSLFPIGSYVALNDGRVGKVIRSNGALYDRPVLEVWNRTNLFTRPEIVDLGQMPDLRVVRSLTRLR